MAGVAGNASYESTSGCPKEFDFPANYTNGQRGNYSGAILRSGSFREGIFGTESQMFSSGTGLGRGNTATLMGELLPLSQCLMLEPIPTVDQKHMRSGELRRILGLPVATAAEGNSSVVTHGKPPSQVCPEELKLFKANVVDASMKARARVKKMNDFLNNLNKYSEALNSKKLQRNQLLVNERPGGSNLLKMGKLLRNPPEVSPHTLEDRSKAMFMNKRVRSSIAETRAEGRSGALHRHPFVVRKDRNMLKDDAAASDVVEDKFRKFPAGGEGWDKKMKRKRSAGSTFARSMDGEVDAKRFMHKKLSNEPRLQSRDAKSFRLNNLEGNHTATPLPIIKGKGSRAARSGSVALVSSSPNFSCSSGELEVWEQPPNVNKIHSISGAYNRKHPIPTGSSPKPMAQWVGQKPKNNSRICRNNTVSPVSNLDEMHTSSEGCSPSDFGAKTTSNENNVSLLARSETNCTQQSKIKLETVLYPARLSESEESGAGGSRSKEKCIAGGEVSANDENVGPSALFTKKIKIFKEVTVDGVRRQGSSGRVPVPNVKISPMREKLENSAPTKPLRNGKRGSDKSGSKPGRPLKKLLDRKSLTRLGQARNYRSPDCTGDSDDDLEELSAAAKFASNSSYLSCPSFWKKMEHNFGSVSFGDKSDLERHINSAKELHDSLSEMFGHRDNVLGDYMDKEQLDPPISGERVRSLLNQTGLKEFDRTLDLVDQFEDRVLYGRPETKGGLKKVPPLYQRVLSALILSDEGEECEEAFGGRDISNRYPTGNSMMEFDYGSVTEMQTKNNIIRSSCNGDSTFAREPSGYMALCNDMFFQGDGGTINSEFELFPEFNQNDLVGSQSIHMILPCKSSCNSTSQQLYLEDRLLLEFQNIGIYLEAVPDLAEGEDDLISQEIVSLKKGLHQMVDKKQARLGNIQKTIQDLNEVERRDVEQIALDRLVEMTYRKQLGTRGITSKSGAIKLSKQADMAFVKRTLARCHKYEETGKSCFMEPPLKEVLLAMPSFINDEKSICLESNKSTLEPRVSGSFIGSAERHGLYETLNHSSGQAFANNRPTLNRGKKKEVIIDDGGSAALRATSTLRNTFLSGPKGKRSEKDRNFIPKASRKSMSHLKGERKSKPKPKQKTAQVSSSEPRVTATHSTHPTGNRSNGLASNSNINKIDNSKDLNDPFDSIDDLGVANELGDDQDLGSWLNIDEDGLQDHDTMGLDIPMDDLFDLNMF